METDGEDTADDGEEPATLGRRGLFIGHPNGSQNNDGLVVSLNLNDDQKVCSLSAYLIWLRC